VVVFGNKVQGKTINERKNLTFRSVEFVESGYGGFSLVTTGNDTVPTLFTFLGPDVLRGISL